MDKCDLKNQPFLPSEDDVILDLMPYSNLTLVIRNNFSQPIIEINLAFGFVYYTINDSILLVGHEVKPLTVENEQGKAEITGVGFGNIRIHSFAYVDSGALFDHWSNETECYTIDGTSGPRWSIADSSSSYSGPIPLENVSQITYAGCIIEIDDLAIFFNDDSYHVCNSGTIVVGVNFTCAAETWSIINILRTTINENVEITENRLTISLQNDIPPAPDEIGPNASIFLFGISVPMTVIPISGILILIAIVILSSWIMIKKTRKPIV